VHETFLAEAEAETEAFWPETDRGETEAFVNLSEARPRPRLITRKCAFLKYSKLGNYLK